MEEERESREEVSWRSREEVSKRRSREEVS